MDTLTFGAAQNAFRERSNKVGRKGIQTALQLANALAGKAGKLCGSAKFEDRGAADWNPAMEGPFLADVVGYCILYANHRGLDLGAEVRAKFNADSDRLGAAGCLLVS